MLKEMNAAQKPQEEELQARLEEARKKLFAQQMQLKEHKLPVIVLFEGWGAAGKGSTIGKIIKPEARPANRIEEQMIDDCLTILAFFSFM